MRRSELFNIFSDDVAFEVHRVALPRGAEAAAAQRLGQHVGGPHLRPDGAGAVGAVVAAAILGYGTLALSIGIVSSAAFAAKTV